LIDRLWAADLKGLVAGVGPVTVAAPKLGSPQELRAWGPGTESVTTSQGLTFHALPLHGGRFDLAFPFKARAALRKAVANADVVHTSNLFFPSTAFYFAHDLAARLGKKTLFVVAEDFYDMLNWEWVRTAPNAFQRFRRRRTLNQLDRMVRKRVASASLTFLHTPAAVARYREFAANAVAIRQPVHELEDIIPVDTFASKCAKIFSGQPLQITAACRMQPLKGVDFMVRAAALLKDRKIPVRLTLYGSGVDLERYKQLANTLGVADTVLFPGSVSPGLELQQALNQSDVFLMPHLTTDFGRAFFDAMAAGAPVLAFRSLASQDTVREGVDGLITPNADFEGLADAIARLHADRAFLVRLATAARDRALVNTKSDWHKMRAQIVRDTFNMTTAG
jgi:glycosyltransferase involved in cell wall biosynthesis